MAASTSIQLTLLLKSYVTQFDDGQSVHIQLDETAMHRITDAAEPLIFARYRWRWVGLSCVPLLHY